MTLSHELLSITTVVFVNSETKLQRCRSDQKISNESNTSNYSDWNTSYSSSDNDDDTNEVLDEEKESTNTKNSSRHCPKCVKKGSCL